MTKSESDFTITIDTPRASYGVSIVRISEKIDHVITLYMYDCICISVADVAALQLKIAQAEVPAETPVAPDKLGTDDKGGIPANNGNLVEEEDVKSSSVTESQATECIGTITAVSTPLLSGVQIKEELPMLYECEYCFVLMDSEEALEDHKQVHWANEVDPTGSIVSTSTEDLEDGSEIKTEANDDDYVPASDTDNDEDYQPKRKTPRKKQGRSRRGSQASQRRSQNGTDADDVDGKSARVKDAMRTINGVVEYPCDKCDKVYDTGQKLRRHLSVHDTPLKPNQCGICKKIFKTAEALEFHRPVHSEMGPYCIMCGKQYTCTSTLARHVRDAHKEQKLTCDVCFVAFANEKNLEKHKVQHDDPNQPHSCEVCNKKFSQLKLLMLHGRLHREPKKAKAKNEDGDDRPRKKTKRKKGEDGELANETSEELNADEGDEEGTSRKQLQCEVCGYSCTLPYLLKRHKLVHSDEKPYMCSACGKSFRHLSALKNHERVHTGERPYECEVCGLRCKTVGNLIKHRASHTGENKTYTCDMCDRKFTNGMPLRHHMERDHGIELPHKCQVCSHIFSCDDGLKKHLEQYPSTFTCDMCEEAFHTKEKMMDHIDKLKCQKDHPCPDCGEVFHTVGYLNKHISNSCCNGTTSCDQCGRVFETPKKLRLHMRTHQPKTHICDECGKAFPRAHCLKKHRETVHMKIRKYQCPQCIKCYAYSSDLYRHLRTHVDAKPFECPICGKKAAYSNNLRKHMRKVHGVEMPTGFLLNTAGASDSNLELLAGHFTETSMNEGKLSEHPSRFALDSDTEVYTDSDDSDSGLPNDQESSAKPKAVDISNVSSADNTQTENSADPSPLNSIDFASKFHSIARLVSSDLEGNSKTLNRKPPGSDDVLHYSD